VSFGRRFLREPERLLAAAGREGQGGARLGLCIAGVTFRLAGLDEAARERLAERFRGFEVPEARGSGVEMVVALAPAAEFLHVDTRGWEYDLDLAPDREGVAVAGLKLAARIEREPLHALLVTAAGPDELAGVVENLLRILVAYALLARGGALVHGAGVARGDRAGLFFGVSGAGKTTLSRLAHAAGRRILSDDMLALVPEAGGVRALSAPFAGEFRDASRHKGLDLDGIFRLRQAPRHALRPLRRSEALAALVVCTPFVNRDPWVADRLLGNLDALLRLAPARELFFAPEAGFLDLLEAAS